MNPSILAEVVNVEIEAEYQGTVFERTVRIRVGTEEFNCYEDASHVTEADTGEKVDLVLLAQPVVDYEVNNSEGNVIVQQTATESETSKWHTEICGVVQAIDSRGDEDRYLCVDVGAGTVLVPIEGQLMGLVSDGEIEVGSNITIVAGRLDVIDRNN